jgi:hypothetical protein
MISLLLTIALVGFLVYLITTIVPMPDQFKKAIIVIAVVILILYLVRVFGIDMPLPTPHR